MVRRLCLCVFLAAAGCAPASTGPRPSEETPPRAEQGVADDQTRNEPAEFQAKHCILGKVARPATVEFLSFGPNDDKGELRELTKNIRVEPDAAPFRLDVLAFQKSQKVVRVRYRAENNDHQLALHDVLVWLGEEGRCGVFDNLNGESWLEVYRKRFTAEAAPSRP